MIPNYFQNWIGSGIEKNVGYWTGTQPITVGCLETLNSFRVVEKGVRALLRMVRCQGVGSTLTMITSTRRRSSASILAMVAILATVQAEPNR